MPTIIDTNININSLGPISNFEMVSIFDDQKMSIKIFFLQSYTMDCYFRQGIHILNYSLNY